MVRVPSHSWSALLNYSKNRLSQNLNFKYSLKKTFLIHIIVIKMLLEKNITDLIILNYKINKRFNFYFNLENIFNENYEQAYIYSTINIYRLI